MSNDLGKRYVCNDCGTQLLCTRRGEGSVQCCGKPMELLQPKPLPSAD